MTTIFNLVVLRTLKLYMVNPYVLRYYLGFFKLCVDSLMIVRYGRNI